MAGQRMRQGLTPEPNSSQHLWLATYLSWSGPGQGEVIVVEGKKLTKHVHCARSGLFACHVSLALPLPYFSGALTPAGCFSQAFTLDASAYVQSMAGNARC